MRMVLFLETDMILHAFVLCFVLSTHQSVFFMTPSCLGHVAPRGPGDKRVAPGNRGGQNEVGHIWGMCAEKGFIERGPSSPLGFCTFHNDN